MMNSAELRDFAEETIRGIVNTSPLNSLQGFEEKAWDSPIIGFASGDDPLFNSYKEEIGGFYWTPQEAMHRGYEDQTFDDRGLSVICWILPQTEKTLKEQRQADTLPASRWVHSRYYGEKFNEHLRSSVRDTFRAAGFEAVAPAISDDFGYRESKKFGLASNWSERHTAFVAGLGTFGLSDGFISERGKAVRIGSIVVNAVIDADPRCYNSHMDNCLWYARGTCGACIKRCPINAISAEGHDKKACFDYIRNVTAPYSEKLLGFYETPCGLCQVRIPCERRNPVR